MPGFVALTAAGGSPYLQVTTSRPGLKVADHRFKPRVPETELTTNMSSGLANIELLETSPSILK